MTRRRRRRLSLGGIRFNAKAGRYTDSSGNFIKRDRVVNEIDKEQRRLDKKLQLRYTNFLNGKLTLQQFEREFIKQTKNSFIRTSLVGHGGLEQFQSKYQTLKTSAIEQDLDDIFEVFFQLVGKLDNLSEKQIRDRLNRISRKARIRFNQAELENKILNQGHNVAIRVLDGAADHCPDCPGLETNGFVAIDKVVPVGTACRCGGYCRCHVRTKFDPRAAIVARSQVFRNNIIRRKEAVSVMLDSIAKSRKP